MDHKNIKLIVRKQLKRQFPHWKRLSKKVKKELARNVLSTVVSEYDFKQEISAPNAELLAIETQLPTKGILSLDEMAGFIDMFNNNRIIKLSNIKRSSRYIADEPFRYTSSCLTLRQSRSTKMLSNARPMGSLSPKNGLNNACCHSSKSPRPLQ